VSGSGALVGSPRNLLLDADDGGIVIKESDEVGGSC
jgi:hypothetical protein